MRELEYQLVKEDYENWLHWNVVNNQSKKMKLATAILYVMFIGVFLGGNIKLAEGDISKMLPSIIVALIVAVGMIYISSNKNQERTLWKKMGLQKMERANAFPRIHLKLDEKSLSFSVVGNDMAQNYSYCDIVEIKELERLYILKTSRKIWQLVAKSAFRDQKEMEEFRKFMENKIEDAKSHPDQYPAIDSTPLHTSEKRTAQPDPERPGSGRLSSVISAASGEEDAVPEITPVDTSHMGKIGKMAHIMAAMAAENEEGSEPAKEEPKAEEEPASEENADASDVQLPEEEKPQKAEEI